MSNVQQIIKRNAYAFAAGIFTLAAVLPSIVTVTPVSAAQITNRQITMGSSVKAAANQTYEVSFDVQSNSVVQGIVVDFCALSPIVTNGTCTAPTGFAVGTGTVTVGGDLTGTWTAAASNANRTLTITNGSGGSLSAGDTVTFSVPGFTNPTDAGTFYARILTYATTANAGGYTVGSLTNVVDSGGVALAATDKIGVTATVQETLTFCVSGSSPASACGGLSTADIVLGDGTPVVLGTSAASNKSVFFQLSTNAAAGAIVRLKGDTLKSGGNTIPALNVASPLTSSGSVGFGFNVTDNDVTPVAGAIGTVAATAPYHTTDWAMVLANTTSTYGDAIASTTGPVYDVNKAINFGARANGSTPAGAYTTDLALVAVGKY